MPIFNCVTLATFKDISIIDYRKSSIMIFDNSNMKELAQFEFMKD